MTNLTTLRRNPKRFVKETKSWITTRSGLLLYILPSGLIFATIKAFMMGNLPGIMVNAGGYAAYLLAAKLLRNGLQAESIYREKRVTYAPKWPLKTFAAVLVALTTFSVAWLGAHNGFFVSIAFGAGALLGMTLCYGLDPRKKKMVAGDHGYSIEEISKTIEDAEHAILSIETPTTRFATWNSIPASTAFARRRGRLSMRWKSIPAPSGGRESFY